MTTPNEKCYSTDNENFNHQDLADALDELDNNGANGLEAGMKVYEADATRHSAGHYFDIDAMFDHMGERAHDHGGEYADDFPDVAPAKRAELEKMVRDWLDANVDVHFYSVKNAKEILVTEEMVSEYRS